MRYTHVGIRDQARALAGLPAPASTDKAGRCPGQQSVSPTGHSPAPQDNAWHDDTKNLQRQTLASQEVMTLQVSPWQNLAQILLSGGGGNRTRRPFIEIVDL